MSLPIGEVGQVVLALLPTRLQGFPDTLSFPVMLTLHLGGDFGVLDWKFQNFQNFFIGREKWTTVFCVAETEVLHYLLLLYRKVAKGKVEKSYVM